MAQIPWFLVFLLTAFTSHSIQAQEKARRDSKSPGITGRYFSRPVDLWKSGLSFSDRGPRPTPPLPTPLPGHVQVHRTIWAEPIKLPDGRIVLYVPPPQVLEFLENPTLETARAYNAFQKERAEKMRKALLLLARVKKELAGEQGDAHRPPVGVESPARSPSGEPFTLLYFHSPT